MGCLKLTYKLTAEPRQRCVYNAADGEENRIINMNARLYDPVIGRFVSPDPYVQNPLFSQSYNRYSYCWNNPLIYTDPTGKKVDNDEEESEEAVWYFELTELIVRPDNGGGGSPSYSYPFYFTFPDRGSYNWSPEGSGDYRGNGGGSNNNSSSSVVESKPNKKNPPAQGKKHFLDPIFGQNSKIDNWYISIQGNSVNKWEGKMPVPLQGAVLLFPPVGLVNDGTILFTGQDLQGNPASTFNRVMSLGGICTLGVSNWLYSFGFSAYSAGTTIYKGYQNEKKH